MDSVGGTFGERRGEFDLTLDVLRLAAKGERRTRIMYLANLSHAMLKRYLDGLHDRGFLEKRADETYALTAKGLELRRDMERVLLHFQNPREDAYSPDLVAART